MNPTFPLPAAPRCLRVRCGRPCTRGIVTEGNRNGNEGRPYYTCWDIACMTGFDKPKFSTWDDNIGIFRGNPQCWCGFRSRRNTSDRPGTAYYYSCSVGGCRFIVDVPRGPGTDRTRVAVAEFEFAHTSQLGPQAGSVAAVSQGPRYAAVQAAVEFNIEAQRTRRTPIYNEITEPRPVYNKIAGPRPVYNEITGTGPIDNGLTRVEPIDSGFTGMEFTNYGFSGTRPYRYPEMSPISDRHGHCCCAVM